MKGTQAIRVLRAARKAGRRGITAVDFALPNVIDGGKPITRLAARINELQEIGFTFRDGGRRSQCKVYVLDSVPVSWDWEREGSVAPVGLVGPSWGHADASDSLFKETPANAIFGHEDAA